MLKKSFSKTKPSCKVTFTYRAELAGETVSLCGDFNDWDPTTHLMKKNKDGSFSISLTLDTGHDYQFRYLVDDINWENDGSADRYEPNSFGEDNCVIELSNIQDDVRIARSL